MIELLVSAALVLVVALAVGSMYLSTLKTYDQGSARAFLQRQGTMIQEHLSRLIMPAIALPVGACNNITEPAASQQVVTASGALCIYRNASDSQFYVCDWSGSACSNTRNLLLGTIQPIRATSVIFTPLALVGVNPSIDISFELQVANQSEPPVRFGMNVTLRN